MIQVDEKWFSDYGIKNLSASETAILSDKVTADLQQRVGNKLAERMSKDQLDRFNTALDNNAEDAQLTLIQEVCPDFESVVKRELDAIGGEMKVVGKMTLLKSLKQ